MYCAISGVVPEEPVVSAKSGHIFEKRLIEKALDATNGRCPETGQELSKQDLIAIKPTGNVSRPVPPTATSLPGILQHLQNEWDTVMLENHRLKMVLNETRQELAHALYQYDAATRVIARLMEEKEAAVGNVTSEQVEQPSVQTEREEQPAAAEPASLDKQVEQPCSNGVGNDIEVKGRQKDVVMENSQPIDAKLPSDILKQIESTCQELQTKRKARVLPSTLATSAQVGRFSQRSSLSLDEKSVAITSVEIVSDIVYSGTSVGKIHRADVDGLKVSGSANKAHSDANGGVTRICRTAQHVNRLLSSGGDGTVKVWEVDRAEWKEKDSFQGPSAVVDIATHPIGTLLLCCYEKGRWVWRDIERAQVVSCREDSGVHFGSAAVHPDGMIFAAGRRDGIVQMWDAKSMKCIAELGEKSRTSTGVTSVEMSDKGYYMASCADGRVNMWDLRKQQVSGQVVVDEEHKGRVAVSLDRSGTFGCGAGLHSAVLFAAKKKADTVARLFTDGIGGVSDGEWSRLGSVWGMDGQYLLLGGADAILRKYAPA